MASEHERAPLLRSHASEEEDGSAPAGPTGSRSARRSRWTACVGLLGVVALVPLAARLAPRGAAAGAPVRALALDECRVRNVSAAPGGFTVVLNTFRRNACLRLAFEHWARCDAVRQVRVSWSDIARPPPTWLQACAAAEPDRFVVDVYHFNRLSNRFRPLPAAPSDALFSVDDDVFFACELAAEAHARWAALRTGARGGPTPHRAATGDGASTGAGPMVGFAPRLLRPSGGYNWMASFRAPFRQNPPFATKGALLHRDDHAPPRQPRFSQLVEQVDRHTTAEDISLSVIFAAARGLPPVHVAAHASQVTDLCCTGSTELADGLAAVSPPSVAAREADPVCRAAKGGTLHWRTADFRDAIQREAVRLAGDTIYRLNVSAVSVLPSTLRALANASEPRSPAQAYFRKRLVAVR